MEIPKRTLEKIHEIDCHCEGLDTEDDYTAFGTRCSCKIMEIKDDRVIEKIVNIPMVDLKKMTTPSPYDVLRASQTTPSVTYEFKNENEAIAKRTELIGKGHIALLGLKEEDGIKKWIVEDYGEKR